MTRILCRCMEAVLLAIVVLSPWPFGSVHAPFELWVAVGVAAIIALWGVREVIAGRVAWPTQSASNWFMAALYVLFAMAILQTVSLPSSVVATLSPNTAAYVQSLTPATRERVSPTESTDARDASSFKSVPESARWSAGNKLSLNPGGSYAFSVRIIGLCGLFMAVTALPLPHKILVRLSITAAICGTAFALFGIAQYFSPIKNQLYWYFETNGNGFAAFRNRNHYPFFANMALGLSIGLLLERYKRSQRSTVAWLTQDPWAMWLGAAIVFIVASIFICASRGGFVAMAVALIVGITPLLRADQRLKTLTALAGLVVGVAILLSWLGFDLFNSRLTTLAESQEMRAESRWHLWSAALSVVREFPILGAGGDTFRYWESIHHQNEVWNSAIHQGTRADNEFLDLFAEFGLVGFLSLVAMAAVVLWKGYKLSQDSGLANGAWIAMIAVIVHSCLDFGLRVPACAILATAIAALLCNMSDLPVVGQKKLPAAEDTLPQTPPATTTTGNRVGAIGFGLVCLIVAAMLVHEKLRQASAFNLQASAMRAMVAGDLDESMELLVQSTQVLPEDVNNQVQAVRAILRLLDAPSDEELRQSRTAVALALAVQARDLCPLAFEPHVWLAQGFSQLSSSYSKLDYLAAAHRMHPSGSEIAYQYGAELYAAGRFDEAWPVWRDSIRFNAFKQGQIMAAASKRLTAEEVARLVVPAAIQPLFQAANIAERNGDNEAANVYLTHMLALIPDSHTSAKPGDVREVAQTLAMAAQASVRLNNTDQAIEYYERALGYEPAAIETRIALAQLLIKQERYEQAARELRTVLVFDAGNVTAKSLRDRALSLSRKQKR